HGLGYTRFTSRKNNLTATATFFVPLATNAEVHQIKLTNNGTAKKSVSLVSFLEFALYNASDDMQNFQRNFSTGEVEVLTGDESVGTTIIHRTEFRERRNHYAFYWSNRKADGFDTDRETFFGLYNSMGEPQTLLEGKPRNSVANGWSPIGSHWNNLEIEDRKSA